MKRKHFAVIGMVGLVGVEILMGFFSKTEDVSSELVTLTLVFVLIMASMLQASLLEFTLTHRKRKNWRQYPIIGIQFTLFVLIAYWAHKGLGNTLFPGWAGWQLWLAGLGLGLITIFGPEVINDSYEAEETEKPQDRQEGTVEGQQQNYASLAYKQTLVPLTPKKNGHNVDLEKAVDLIKPTAATH